MFVFFPGQSGKKTGGIQIILKNRIPPLTPFMWFCPSAPKLVGSLGTLVPGEIAPSTQLLGETAFISGWTLTPLRRGFFSRQAVFYRGWLCLCHHLPYCSPLQAGVLNSEPRIGKARATSSGWGRQLEDRGDGEEFRVGFVGFAVPIRHASGDSPERRGRALCPAQGGPSQQRQPLVLNALTEGELITSGDSPHVLS